MVDSITLRRAFMDEENITLNEMCEIFNISKEELYESIKKLLIDSENDKQLIERLQQRKDIIFGRIHINRDCVGIVNFGDTKYHINSDDVYDALNEDLVIIEPLEEGKTKAKVKTVVKRNDGLLIANYINGEIKPLNAPITTNIILSDEDKALLKDEDRIEIELDNTIEDVTYAHLKQVIGHKDDLYKEEKTVAVENKFHLYFNKGCLDEELEIPDYVTDREKKGRVDLRGFNAFTMDAEETQDIDDGLFVKTLPNGHILYGVPISHVSHYVKRNGFIFQEAAYRGTSLYEGGHSEPMLCRKLANGIGALKEGEDRLARTLLTEFDANLNKVNSKMVQSVIRSRKKMTYAAVDDILLKDRVPSGYEPFVEDLRLIEKITTHLDNQKYERGALNVLSQDIKPLFDYLYRIIELKPLENLHSRKIVENSALLFNEEIGIELNRIGRTHINRVHEAPSIDKLNDTIKLINNTGYDIPPIDHITDPREINNLLLRLKEDPRLPVYSSLLLHALQKAHYSIKELGHFGLALKFYAQFTSPIRRFPDFINHCIMDDYEAGLPPQFTDAELDEYAKHSSEMELNSDNATNEMNKIHMATLAKDQKGQSKEGMIYNIGPSGLIVKAEDEIKGKIGLKDILYGKNRYVKETNSINALGIDDEKYQLGDKVEVIVKDASIEKRTVDYELVGKVKTKTLKR